ncbi:MAG: hypothetical protein HXS48_13775 [Theionarchaea archaeon]|nr:hypothetical protein [Theionarchaea archaeon]
MSKKNQTEVDMYVLCLHKFRDDRIALTTDELKNASNEIGKCLQRQNYFKNNCFKNRLKKIEGWHVYSLNLEKFDVKELCNLTNAELGYYHHRTIMKFSFDFLYDFYTLREIRRKLKEKADTMIGICVKNTINNIISAGKMENVKDRGKIIYLYTYPFIVVKNGVKKCETVPFSEDTGTLSFDIFRLGKFKLFYERNLMRISGPSMILYTKGKDDKRLLRDIIRGCPIIQNFLKNRRFHIVQ